VKKELETVLLKMKSPHEIGVQTVHGFD